MRYEQDGYQGDQGRSGVLVAFIAGAAIGAGLSMLFAPKTGAELRADLSEGAARVADRTREGGRRIADGANQLMDKAKKAQGEWTARGREFANKAEDALNKAEDVFAGEGGDQPVRGTGAQFRG